MGETLVDELCHRTDEHDGDDPVADDLTQDLYLGGDDPLVLERRVLVEGVTTSVGVGELPEFLLDEDLWEDSVAVAKPGGLAFGPNTYRSRPVVHGSDGRFEFGAG